MTVKHPYLSPCEQLNLDLQNVLRSKSSHIKHSTSFMEVQLKLSRCCQYNQSKKVFLMMVFLMQKYTTRPKDLQAFVENKANDFN